MHNLFVCHTNIVCFHPKKISKIKIKISDVSDIFRTFRESGVSVFGRFGKFSEISDSDVSVFGRFDLYSVGLISSGRCQDNGANDEATFQLGLDLNPGPSGWHPSALLFSP